jgi:iron complex outermembrane receptor protein
MDLIASCPNHMNPALSYLDPTQVDALKVYAGIAPVSLGGDSIGGTIVADTAPPEFAAAGQASLVKGQARRSSCAATATGGGVSLSATYATETFSASYAGAVRQADNYTAGGDFKTSTRHRPRGHTLPLDEVGSTAYKTYNHSLGLACAAATTSSKRSSACRRCPTSSTRTSAWTCSATRSSASTCATAAASTGAAWTRALYHEKVDHAMDFGADKRFWYGALSGTGAPCSPLGGPPASCAAGMPMNSESSNTGAALKARVALGDADELHLGAELQRYRLDDWWPPSGGGMWPGTFWNIADGQRDRSALFAEWEARRGPQWTTLLGLRYEHVKTDAGDVPWATARPTAMGNQFADAARLQCAQPRAQRQQLGSDRPGALHARCARDIEFGFARKVRSPNLYERYTWSTWPMAAVMNNFVGDGNGYVGNRRSEARAGDTPFGHLRLACRRSPLGPQGHAVLHAGDRLHRRHPLRQRRGLHRRQPGSMFVVLQYANQSARLHGLDLSGHMPLAKTGLGRLGTRRAAGTDTAASQPRHRRRSLQHHAAQCRLTLTQKLGGWDNAVELVMVAAKDKVSEVRNEMRTPGYGLVNLRTSYTWKRGRIDFGIDNLFDRFYRLPLGGAYVGQGTTMSINGVPWGVAMPGTGRSAPAPAILRPSSAHSARSRGRPAMCSPRAGPRTAATARILIVCSTIISIR